MPTKIVKKGPAKGRSSNVVTKGPAKRSGPKEFLAAPFDTETTGLIFNRSMKLNKQPEIIEFYGCVVDLVSGKLKDEYHTLIKPTVEYPMSDYTIKATKTKIGNEMLANERQFKIVAKDLKAFLERAPMLIAHNLSFDKEMCEIEFERLEEKIVWPERGLCTVEATTHLRGRRLNLTALHTLLFDEPFSDAHRAKPDVEALTRVAVELYKRGLV